MSLNWVHYKSKLIMNAKSKYQKPAVIAEIGCNHKGEMSIAKDLILEAKRCGASFAKFQKRNNKELLSEQKYNTPHPNSFNSYGATYGEHREFLEFNLQQHKELKDFCEENGIGYSTSVWDITSANEILTLNPQFIKVPSACNNHFGLLQILRDNYKGDVHVSLGMTTQKEEKELINFFKETNQNMRLVIYACTSGYPVSFEEVCLLEINKIVQSYPNQIKDIGFSGHHLGIAIDIAAYTLGANWIERHFTLDRTWKGTDHAASLEPPGLSRLVRDLAATQKALTYKEPDILPIELEQRHKLKYTQTPESV